MPVVYSAANPMEAHLCKQYLEESGIEARVDGEILWQARGDLPPNESTNPTVVVPEEQLSTALELVESFQLQKDDDIKDSWICSACREENPGSFDYCWNCEAALVKTESGEIQ